AMVGVDIRLRLGEQPTEQIHMAAVLAARGLLGSSHRLLHGRQQYRTIAVDAGLIGLGLVLVVGTETIQRAGADQRLQGALVDALEVDPRAEVEEVLERPLATRLNDRLHRRLADALDRAEAVDDAAVLVDG